MRFKPLLLMERIRNTKRIIASMFESGMLVFDVIKARGCVRIEWGGLAWGERQIGTNDVVVGDT